MSANSFQIKIIKEYAIALLEDLTKLGAIEMTAEAGSPAITPPLPFKAEQQQETNLEKDLAALAQSWNHINKWSDIKPVEGKD